MTSTASMEYNLGYALPVRCPKALEAEYFPSKIGGSPVWLARKDVPEGDSLKCSKCGNPMTFLLQVYAPISDTPETFHRSLFVFVCKNNACHRAAKAAGKCGECVKVFRSQLPRKNDYYSFDPPNYDALEDDESDEEEREQPSSGSKSKKDLKAARKEDRDPKVPFPEFELVVEAEEIDDPVLEVIEVEDEEEDGDVDISKQMALVREYRRKQGIPDNEDFDESEFEDLVRKNDPLYEQFLKRTSDNQDQVLRYGRSLPPLWLFSDSKPEKGDVPCCPHCSSERVPEIQILPQLLYYLGLENSIVLRGRSVHQTLDWGTLVIYTCAKSCSASGYSEEFVWKQDYPEKQKDLL